jgi:hypothetical protein
VLLKVEELFTSLQTVHGIAWKEPNIKTFGVSQQTTSSPPTFNSDSTPQLAVQSLPEILIFQVCSVFCQFLPMEKRFTNDAASKEKLFCALKIQVIVQLVESIR